MYIFDKQNARANSNKSHSQQNIDDLKNALYDNLMKPGSELILGAQGIAEGMPEKFENKVIGKFRDDGLHITSTGSKAGMFSAIISGWVASGERGSQLVLN